MEIPYLREAALKRGAVPEVLDALEARAQAHFAGKPVSESDLDTWLQTQVQTWELHGMSYAEFKAVPDPAWQMTQGHRHHPAPAGPHSRRPTTRPLTPAELAAHQAEAAEKGWSWSEANEHARAKQQSPPPEP